jgi:hypothetical protein
MVNRILLWSEMSFSLPLAQCREEFGGGVFPTNVRVRSGAEFAMSENVRLADDCWDVVILFELQENFRQFLMKSL